MIKDYVDTALASRWHLPAQPAIVGYGRPLTEQLIDRTTRGLHGEVRILKR